MDSLFREVPDYRAWRDHDTDPASREILKLRYCVAIGVFIAAGVVTSSLWLPPTVGVASDHWPWLVAIPLGLILLYTAVIFLGEPSALVAVCSLFIVILGALHFDGSWSAWTFLEQQFPSTPPWLWLVGLATVFAVTAIIHMQDRYDLHWVPMGVFGLTFAAIVIPVAWMAAQRAAAPDIAGLSISFIKAHWPPIGSAICVIALGMRFRYTLYSRAENDREIAEPYFDRSHLDTAAPQEPAVRRMIAASRKAGLTAIDLVLTAFTLIFVVTTLLYYLPDLIVASQGLTQAEIAKAKTEERRTVLALLAATGAGITLVYTHLRHMLDRDANITNRFSEAVGHLATTSLSTQLGGIFSLGQIARTSSRDSSNIVELLSAFARSECEARAFLPSEAPISSPTHAALRVLSTLPGDTRNPDLRGIILSESSLDDIRFREGTDLDTADFRASNLENARMRSLVLTRTKFQGATIVDSDLSGSEFGSADLSGATFEEVSLDTASFARASLSGTHFKRVSLKRVSFHLADLRGAVFVDCHLTRETQFSEADIRGCDLSGLDLKRHQVADAQFDDSTIWPSGFRPPTGKRHPRRHNDPP
jgi:uncharacterized protein YjbI with pentapeptide repeats